MDVKKEDQSKKPTSVLTYVVAVIAVAAMTLVTYNQLYQGVDAEKAAALAAQQKAEQQLKDGTYVFAKKFGGPGAPDSPNRTASATAEVKDEKAVSSSDAPAAQESETTEKPKD